jgi:predicted amidophosphoribosyltransferase
MARCDRCKKELPLICDECIMDLKNAGLTSADLYVTKKRYAKKLEEKQYG